MTNFATDCSQPNVVGLPTVEYISTVGIDTFKIFELSDGRLRGTISLKPYLKWLSMPLRPLDSDKQFWDENGSLTAQGNLFSAKVQGILPMMSPQIQSQLDDMERQTFIVRIQDLAGRKFVLGSVKFPLHFTSSWNSAKGFHTVEWAGKQPHKAIGY
jgi:hypothetical protein